MSKEQQIGPYNTRELERMEGYCHKSAEASDRAKLLARNVKDSEGARLARAASASIEALEDYLSTIDPDTDRDAEESE